MYKERAAASGGTHATPLCDRCPPLSAWPSQGVRRGNAVEDIKRKLERKGGHAEALAEAIRRLAECPPTEVASLPPLEESGEDLEVDQEAKYVIAITRQGREARLHKTSGCWRAKRLAFQNFELVDVDPPPQDKYNVVCKDCWPGMSGEAGSTGSSSSSSGCSAHES